MIYNLERHVFVIRFDVTKNSQNGLGGLTFSEATLA